MGRAIRRYPPPPPPPHFSLPNKPHMVSVDVKRKQTSLNISELSQLPLDLNLAGMFQSHLSGAPACWTGILLLNVHRNFVRFIRDGWWRGWGGWVRRAPVPGFTHPRRFRTLQKDNRPPPEQWIVRWWGNSQVQSNFFFGGTFYVHRNFRLIRDGEKGDGGRGVGCHAE